MKITPPLTGNPLLAATAGLILCFVFLGDTPDQEISILAPSMSDTVSYDQGKLILVSVRDDTSRRLLVSSQWRSDHVMDISSKSAREDFARSFYRLFPPGTTIEHLSTSFKFFRGYSKPETLAFAHADTVGIRGLWQKPAFTELVKSVQLADAASEIIVSLRGWKDSIFTTAYDDPADEKRSLYKITLGLIPGENRIYFSKPSGGSREIEYTTRFVDESKPAEERTGRFHNSALEQGCCGCHEGLPSADSGASMKADCALCHKEVGAAAYLHAPAEMKECASCHSWSAVKNAVVVEKGVPAACYDCHDEKPAQVDSSAVPHPVAGECLTCHSPHGTEQPHLLKEDVFTLCTSCHSDYTLNHPVGRHPLRWVKLKDSPEEISCVSCHNPHGSPNPSLLRAPGGRMGICVQCH